MQKGSSSDDRREQRPPRPRETDNAEVPPPKHPRFDNFDDNAEVLPPKHPRFDNFDDYFEWFVVQAPSNALLLNTVCCGLNTIGFTKETQVKLEQEESKGSMAKNAVLPSSSTEVVKIVGRLIKHCSAKVDCNVNTTDVVGAHFSHGRVICTKDDRFKTAVADLVGKLSRDSTYIGPSGNLLQVDMENMEDVDVIIAGPPCPPFSSIGSRGGLNDERAKVFGAVHNMLKNQYRQKALTLWRWWRA